MTLFIIGNVWGGAREGIGQQEECSPWCRHQETVDYLGHPTKGPSAVFSAMGPTPPQIPRGFAHCPESSEFAISIGED
jgi:hypothetical protein